MQKTTKRKPERKIELEVRPDAWARFEHAVDVALHIQPAHDIKSRPKSAGPDKRKGGASK